MYVFSKDYGSVNGYLLGYDFPAYVPTEGENDATNHARTLLLDVMANNTTAKRNFYSSIRKVYSSQSLVDLYSRSSACCSRFVALSQ